MPDTIAIDITLRQTCFGVTTENKFALIGEEYLSLAELDAVRDAFYTNVVQPMNAIQSAGVNNIHLSCTQRGDTIYTSEVGLSDGGVSNAVDAEELPAMFPFYVRLYTGLTFAVQDSVPQTAHPISKGALFVSGADDRYWSNGVFIGTAPESSAWADFLGALTNSFLVGGLTYTPAVLSEAVTTPWSRPVSIAAISGAALRSITKLASRRT